MLKYKLPCLLLTVLIFFTGCQGPGSGPGDEKTSGMIRTSADKDFVIELDSNPTTGYQWQLARPLDNAIIKLIRTEYTPGEEKLIGAGGKERWTFKATNKGEASIYLKYVRPWEKDTAPAKKKEFNIIIK